jgi:hypothetical protein
VSKRSEFLWRSFAVSAAFVYLVAMFAPWRSDCYSSESRLRALAETVTGACGGWWSVFGIASVALCYLIVVFALLGPRRSALSLEPLRVVLSLSLLALTLLDIFWSFWRLAISNEPALIWRLMPSGGIGYGAWVALGASLALLLAFSVLDAGGLGRLLNRLPAWARIDRLEVPEEEAAKAAGKSVASLAERSHRRWTAILALALIVYVLSLFTDWWSYSYRETSGPMLNSVSGGTRHVDGFEGIGEFCALAALAALVVARLARRERGLRLESLRNRFVAFLVGLTLVNVLVVWRQAYERFFPFGQNVARSFPDYGALVTLASILVMLFATLAINAGGWRRLIDRLPGWARLDRLDEPPERNEETA